MEILVGWWFVFAILAQIAAIGVGSYHVWDKWDDLRRDRIYSNQDRLDVKRELRLWLFATYGSPILALLWPITTIVILSVIFGRTLAYTIPTREEREAEIRRLERELRELD